MQITQERRRIRLPLRIPIGLDTGWVEALVFNSALAVHPSVNYPDAGIWTVTLARCGQGIVHLPTEEEARAFCCELLDRAQRDNRSLDWEHHTEISLEAVGWLTRFIQGWHVLRRTALPRYLKNVAIPGRLEQEQRQAAAEAEDGLKQVQAKGKATSKGLVDSQGRPL